jgi:hypothetical protein
VVGHHFVEVAEGEGGKHGSTRERPGYWRSLPKNEYMKIEQVDLKSALVI